MIFVDADAFIALVFEKDAHHIRARDIYNRLKDTEEQLATSWDVVDESATKLSKTVSRKSAETLLRMLETTEIEILFLTVDVLNDCFRFFRKQKSKHVSMTDCSNMVLARKNKITTFFSFDKHYTQNGFKILS